MIRVFWGLIIAASALFAVVTIWGLWGLYQLSR
jgi:hypothetical protein